MKVAAGSSLALQMHYNNALTKEAAPESPTIHLWTLPEGEYPASLIHTYPIAKQVLDIPANAANSKQTQAQRIGGKCCVSSPHMHLLGTQMDTKLTRSDGSEVCLTQVDNWDFNWQLNYTHKTESPIDVSIDDLIEITCTCDNSAANQPVIDGQRAEPRDVTWGDGSRRDVPKLPRGRQSLLRRRREHRHLWGL